MAKSEIDFSVLALLPFRIKRIFLRPMRFGYAAFPALTIELESGRYLYMSTMAHFLSAKSSKKRLLKYGYVLSPEAIQRWSEITTALLLLVEDLR